MKSNEYNRVSNERRGQQRAARNSEERIQLSSRGRAARVMVAVHWSFEYEQSHPPLLHACYRGLHARCSLSCRVTAAIFQRCQRCRCYSNRVPSVPRMRMKGKTQAVSSTSCACLPAVAALVVPAALRRNASSEFIVWALALQIHSKQHSKSHHIIGRTTQ